MSIQLRIPTEEQQRRWTEECITKIKLNRAQMREAAIAAKPALNRLAEVLKCRSGQPYKLRAILFSLWANKPAPMSEIVCLDWEIRKDLCAVMLGFGYEDPEVKMFYRAIKAAITAAGQWEWFEEERQNVELYQSWTGGAQ